MQPHPTMRTLLRVLPVLLVSACARDVGQPCSIAAFDASTVAVAPVVAVAPPAVVATPVPPAPVAPSVTVEALLEIVPRFEPSRVPLDTDFVEAAVAMLRSPQPSQLDQIVPAVHAVIADPRSVQARFVMACTLAQHGLHVHAEIAIRTLLAAKDCPACLDAVVNVADQACSFEDSTRAITAQVEPSAIRTAAEAILAAINSGETAAITQYLDGPSQIDETCSVCDFERTTPTRYSRDGFLAFVRRAEQRMEQGPYYYTRPMLLFCTDRCCSGPLDLLSHTQISVTSICFRGPKHAPKLDRITTLAG